MDSSVFHNINPGTFRRDLTIIPIKHVILTGDLPTDQAQICELLKRSRLPYFNTFTVTDLGIIQLDRLNTCLNIQGPKDWKLYDLTLREVVALKGLLAEEGINADLHNFHF